MFENPRGGRHARNFTKNVPKIDVGIRFIMVSELPDAIVRYLLYNSTGAFGVWVKALGNDFSTELT